MAAAEFQVQRSEVLAATALAYTAVLAAEQRLALAAATRALQLRPDFPEAMQLIQALSRPSR